MSSNGLALAFVIALAACGVSFGAPRSEEPPPPPPGPSTAMNPGLAPAWGMLQIPHEPLGWRWHQDSNALVALQRTGAHLIGLTEAGALVRWRLDPFGAVSVEVPPVSLRGLSGGYALSADGLHALDRLTAEPTIALQSPLWTDGEQAVYARDGRLWLRRLNSRYEVPFPFSGAIYAASDGRVYVGRDQGEWGGRIGYAALAGAQLEEYSQATGILGFAEYGGEVLAFGGMSHMGYHTATLCAVGQTKCEPVDWLAGGPQTPITHAWVDGDDLMIADYQRIWRYDGRGWSEGPDLTIRYRWGRPDAMGAYPALRDRIPLDDGRQIFATARDGLGVLTDEDFGAISAPGQLGARYATGAGVVGDLLWIWGGGEAWTRTDAWYSILLSPTDPPAAGSWMESRLLHDPVHSVRALSRSNVSPGTRALMRWSGSSLQEIERIEDDSTWASAAFATPDGALWLWEYGGGVKRLDIDAPATWRSAPAWRPSRAPRGPGCCWSATKADC